MKRRADIERLRELRAATGDGGRKAVQAYTNALGEACEPVERGGAGMLDELEALRWFHEEVLRISVGDYNQAEGWAEIAELYSDERYAPILDADPVGAAIAELPDAPTPPGWEEKVLASVSKDSK